LAGILVVFSLINISATWKLLERHEKSPHEGSATATQVSKVEGQVEKLDDKFDDLKDTISGLHPPSGRK